MEQPAPLVVAVIQARMSSTRLPGKVLRPLGDRPVVDWVTRAAHAAKGVDRVIVATSTEADDDVLVDHLVAAGEQVLRGDLDDVLGRFLAAVDVTGADVVVRLTADCPLLDPRLIDAAVAVARSGPWAYVSTVDPRCLPRGLDVEVVTAAALTAAGAEATGTDRVHVTPFVRDHPERFPAAGLVVHPAADDLRVTLDTEEDAALLDGVVAALGNRIPAWHEVVALLRSRPDLVALNATVEQKPLSAG